VWNGVRVFPVPSECLGSADFLRVLMEQQRPHVVLSNLPRSAIAEGLACLSRSNTPWIDRVNPVDAPGAPASAEAPTPAAGRHVTLIGKWDGLEGRTDVACVPYLRGLDPGCDDGEDPTLVLNAMMKAVVETAEAKPSGGAAGLPVNTGGGSHCTHIVMRQELFSNSSVANVMFELTNALIELGVPTIPQDEHRVLAREVFHREENLLRAGAPAKYERIVRQTQRSYDPENAVTVHFCMLRERAGYSEFGTFRSLASREVLYDTGNKLITPTGVRQVTDAFHMMLAPSKHVLGPYLNAGLSPSRGAVIPHGVDPQVFSPGAAAFPYPTRKGFKFLQTSFPWICEKGFDLTIQAFCAAFSSRDDVTLILRTPRVREEGPRGRTFGQLEGLVKEHAARPGAPEILLLEMDLPSDRRGGIYTGADAYLFPLRAEGFGMTILEAMACGLPVIATPWSGPADFLSARYAYLLRHSAPILEKTAEGVPLRYHVEPEMEHLVSLIRHVYEHRSEAQEMGRQAAEVARRNWTWKLAAAKLASLFSLYPTP
jgi:glycosyltransferase involved in cell wall biosynthesis